MNQVFLDTVGMIAVWDETDQWHAAAKAAYQQLLSEGRRRADAQSDRQHFLELVQTLAA